MLNSSAVKFKLKEFSAKGLCGIVLWVPYKSEIVIINHNTEFKPDAYDVLMGYSCALTILQYRVSNGSITKSSSSLFKYNHLKEPFHDDICSSVYTVLEYLYDFVPDFIPLSTFSVKECSDEKVCE